MTESIEKLSAMYSELIASEPVSFDSVAGMKNVMGVYIIYSPEQKILYIGSTNKFHIRFGTDLKHESTHTLVRKFLKQEIFSNRGAVVDYLSNKCKYRIFVCENKNKREAEALEHIAIWMLGPEHNK